MTNEETTLEENVENKETTTLDENAESEEVSVDDLFEEEEEESKDESEADKIKRLEEQIARVEKGIQKIATEKGKEKKQEPKEEKKEVSETSVNDEVVEELLLTKHPEAEHILDDLRSAAKDKGVSVLKLYRESKYFPGEAKAIADAIKNEEENKRKIKKPANGAPTSKKDVLSTKAEDVKKLSPADKLAWVKEQARKERESVE